jgi:PTS system nitrogen regulatory IIA component
MQLTVRDVARLLDVSENEVYRWVRDDGLPAEEVNGQYRFNRAELLEWATIRKRHVPPAFFQPEHGDGPPRLDRALRAGGIHHHIQATDRASALRAIVQALPLPAGIDRDFLTQVFLSRESAGSTAVGDGLALPHPRYPIVLPITHAFVSLCFLDQPIPYGAADRQPVHTLFALVSPTVRDHLALLARLAAALKDPAFREVIRRRAPADEILAQVRRLEEEIRGPAAGEREETDG